MEILPVTPDRLPEALSLCWNVFCLYNAPTFPSEGIGTFHAYLHPDHIGPQCKTGRLQLYAAYQESQMIGVLALRGFSHISLLFVEGVYQGQGVGSALIRYALFLDKKAWRTSLSVHAAPYALAFYHGCGFEDIGPQTMQNGILYTPMRHLLQ